MLIDCNPYSFSCFGGDVDSVLDWMVNGQVEQNLASNYYYVGGPSYTQDHGKGCNAPGYATVDAKPIVKGRLSF